jgi:hypothetical protein
MATSDRIGDPKTKRFAMQGTTPPPRRSTVDLNAHIPPASRQTGIDQPHPHYRTMECPE